MNRLALLISVKPCMKRKGNFVPLSLYSKYLLTPMMVLHFNAKKYTKELLGTISEIHAS